MTDTNTYFKNFRLYCTVCNAQLVRNPGTSTIKTVHPAENAAHLAHK